MSDGREFRREVLQALIVDADTLRPPGCTCAFEMTVGPDPDNPEVTELTWHHDVWCLFMRRRNRQAN